MERRKLLTVMGVGSSGLLAGCLGGDYEERYGQDGDDEGGDGEEPDGMEDEITDEEDEQHTTSETMEATLHTSKGDVDVEVYPEKVPETVDNFVGLATGERTWTHPETGEEMDGEPLYDDVLFHRVIEGFMIQTGDPLGDGTGGPGYTFDDEFHPDLRHDSAGVLSMANSGPDTNGSQFFITLDAQPHLDDNHAVFGEVVDGMDVVREIGGAETDGRDRPEEDVLLESVSIHD